MNTKIIILLSFFFLLIAIVGFANKSMVEKKQSLYYKHILIDNQDNGKQHMSDLVPFKMGEANGKEKEQHKPNSEEDGKHHHFHFSRINFYKRSYVLLFIAKIILFISHISVLIFTFLHAFH